MAGLLVEQLHQRVDVVFQKAFDAVGLSDVKDFRFIPPTDPKMGDLGLPCHPFARVLRKNPKVIAEDIASNIELGNGLLKADAVNGYVNVFFDPSFLIPRAVKEVFESGKSLGFYDDFKGKTLQIEFSGPNTNKPQHLGHVRNNVIGLSTANLMEAVGYKVIRTNIINDRGIHICKSMLAYKKWGEDTTPASTGTKGDHFVGKYYVKFNEKSKVEYSKYLETNPAEKLSEDDFFNGPSALGLEVRTMLQDWEANEPSVRALWSLMNGWVFEGFDVTYKRLGIDFEWVDYESDTYLLGKKVVEDALGQGLLEKRKDGAVICDLEKIGMENQKVLLRPDGTSVYMTQDLGTAKRRFENYNPDRMIYTVADEQNYHFKVLFGILDLLEKGKGSRCHHLSYGMVELLDGRMKSLEGNVVYADQLMSDLRDMALEEVKKRYQELSEEEQVERAEKIGQAGLKFFLLKFDPSSWIKFDDKKSIQFNGETGPYCLYNYARINSLKSKLPEQLEFPSDQDFQSLGSELETILAKTLMKFPQIVKQSADGLNSSKLAQYLWLLANHFASLYQDREHRLLDLPKDRQAALLALLKATQDVLRRGLEILGIDVIEQM